MLKLVPFDDAWVTNDSKSFDLHAIYRRPRWTRNEWDEVVRVIDENGLPCWDLTSALPVRQHNKWRQKGFEYVTLANRESLAMAARGLRAKGLNPADFDQHPEQGPWNYKRFLEGQAEQYREDVAGIESDVERFGPDVAEEIRKRSDQSFVLPPKYRSNGVGASDEEVPIVAKRGPGRPRKDESVLHG